MSRTKTQTAPGTAKFADLEWSDTGQPRSRQFGDVYFSAGDGLAEAKHVFLQGNDLRERWLALAAQDRFIIGETGFGTGLNFLAAWALWLETAPESAQLEFLSAEAFPLLPADLKEAHLAWPELAPLAQQLQSHYPRCMHPGVHRLVLLPGRITLTLLINDAVAGFEDCFQSRHPAHRIFEPGINAWFLDGFAPARNPDMWRPELFACMQAMSAPHASVATFTAAGDVRRGLKEAGFEVSKHRGFGKKRDMTRAHLIKPHQRPGLAEFPASPRAGDLPLAWDLPDTGQQASHGREPVVVIGAGLAGCHAARALAERGLRVLILDRAQHPASGGSGNAQGVLYARPGAQESAASAFNLAALQFAERHYERWWTNSDNGQSCGVLHLARNSSDARRQQALADRWPDQTLFQVVDARAGSELAGIKLESPGLWFPGSGWLAPRVLCHELLAHETIELRQANVAQLQRLEDEWRVLDADGNLVTVASRVILACALGLRGLVPGAELPVQAVRGQLSRVSLQDSDPGYKLKVALCGDGYITPVQAGQLNFGASFIPNDESLELRPAEHEQNLKRLREQAPDLLPEHFEASQCEGRAALRCATPDRLPMVGPVPDDVDMARRFAALGKNADASLADPGTFLEGLFVSAGYGSRGLAYVPLATELLCWHLLGGTPPVSRSLRRALHPARFLIRDVVRGKR